MSLYGVCIGTLFTSVTVTAAQLFQNDFSRVNAAFMIVSMAGVGGAPLLQLLVDNMGWRGAMFILAAFHLHIVVSSLLFDSKTGKCVQELKEEDVNLAKSPSLQRENRFFNRILETMKLDIFKNNQQLILLFTSGVCAGVAHTTYYIFLVPYAEEFGISALDASFLKVAPVISCLVARLILIFVPQYEVHNALIIYALAQIFELTGFMLLACWQSLIILYIGSSLHGLALGMQLNSIMTLATMFVKKEEDIAYSVSWNIFSEGLASLFTAVIGLLMNSYQLGFQICFGFQILGMALVADMVIRQFEHSNYTRLGTLF